MAGALYLFVGILICAFIFSNLIVAVVVTNLVRDKYSIYFGDINTETRKSSCVKTQETPRAVSTPCRVLPKGEGVPMSWSWLGRGTPVLTWLGSWAGGERQGEGLPSHLPLPTRTRTGYPFPPPPWPGPGLGTPFPRKDLGPETRGTPSPWERTWNERPGTSDPSTLPSLVHGHSHLWIQNLPHPLEMGGNNTEHDLLLSLGWDLIWKKKLKELIILFPF